MQGETQVRETWMQLREFGCVHRNLTGLIRPLTSLDNTLPNLSYEIIVSPYESFALLIGEQFKPIQKKN